MRLAPVLAALVSTALAYPAQAGYLVIQSDPTLDYHSAKCINGGDEVDVHVMYIPTSDEPVARRIQFMVPDPPCASVYARKDIHILPANGTSDFDIVVDFLGCPTTPIHILTIRFSALSVLSNCCAWRPLSTYGQSLITAWDCEGNEIRVVTRSAFMATEPCAFTAPHSPVPADGATIESHSVALGWQSAGGPACNPGDVLIHNVHFGTDPDALDVYADVGAPLVIGNLLPSTAYYWRVEATTYNGAGPYPGPLWSFNTPAPLASQESTWGRVKSLYR